MELAYGLMRKNDRITTAVFSDDGYMLRYSKEMENIDLVPLQDRYQLPRM